MCATLEEAESRCTYSNPEYKIMKKGSRGLPEVELYLRIKQDYMGLEITKFIFESLWSKVIDLIAGSTCMKNYKILQFTVFKYFCIHVCIGRERRC